MIRLDLTPEEQELQDLARKLADEVVKPRALAHDHAGSYPYENCVELARHGFMGIKIPKEHGGLGLGEFCNVLVHEEINRACAATGVSISVHNSLFVGPLKKFGNQEQQARYFPRLASYEITAAYCLSEPEHGSDALGMETRYADAGDHYLLNGTKAWITSGDKAGVMIVFATKDPALRSAGVSAFLVEPGFDGFSVGKKEEKLGILGSTTVQLHFDDMKVPKANLMGEEGQGFKIAMDTLDGGRIGIAAQGVGIAQAALDFALDHVEQGHRDGKPLSRKQSVQWKVADMATEIEAARLLVYRAARLRDAGLPYSKEASMAKLYASEVANRAARQAMQVIGPLSYLQRQEVERLYRDAKITEIYEGTSQIQRLVISRHVIGR